MLALFMLTFNRICFWLKVRKARKLQNKVTQHKQLKVKMVSAPTARALKPTLNDARNLSAIMEDCSESDLSNYMPRKKDLLRGVIDDLERLSEKKLELQKPVQTRAD